MKEERTRAMVTATAVSAATGSSARRREKERGREREVMIIWRVDNEQRTLNRKIEKESKKRAWVR
jgi:hypothetical protein